jgi:hypothetical protein
MVQYLSAEILVSKSLTWCSNLHVCVLKDTRKRMRRKMASTGRCAEVVECRAISHLECSNTAPLARPTAALARRRNLVCNGTNYQIIKNRNPGSRCGQTNVRAIEISGTVSPYGLSSAADTVERPAVGAREAAGGCIGIHQQQQQCTYVRQQVKQP